MNQKNSGGFLRGLLYLVVGLLLGTAVALVIHWIVAGQFDIAHLIDRPDVMVPLAWFAGILVGIVGFFYGLVGYRWITRGLVWQFVFTLIGAGFATLLLWVSNLFFNTSYVIFDPAHFASWSRPGWSARCLARCLPGRRGRRQRLDQMGQGRRDLRARRERPGLAALFQRLARPQGHRHPVHRHLALAAVHWW